VSDSWGERFTGCATLGTQNQPDESAQGVRMRKTRLSVRAGWPEKLSCGVEKLQTPSREVMGIAVEAAIPRFKLVVGATAEG